MSGYFWSRLPQNAEGMTVLTQITFLVCLYNANIELYGSNFNAVSCLT